jgi:hypothetical protein
MEVVYTADTPSQVKESEACGTDEAACLLTWLTSRCSALTPVADGKHDKRQKGANPTGRAS